MIRKLLRGCKLTQGVERNKKRERFCKSEQRYTKRDRDVEKGNIGRNMMGIGWSMIEIYKQICRERKFWQRYDEKSREYDRQRERMKAYTYESTFEPEQ